MSQGTNCSINEGVGNLKTNRKPKTGHLIVFRVRRRTEALLNTKSFWWRGGDRGSDYLITTFLTVRKASENHLTTTGSFSVFKMDMFSSGSEKRQAKVKTLSHCMPKARPQNADAMFLKCQIAAIESNEKWFLCKSEHSWTQLSKGQILYSVVVIWKFPLFCGLNMV